MKRDALVSVSDIETDYGFWNTFRSDAMTAQRHSSSCCFVFSSSFKCLRFDSKSAEHLIVRSFPFVCATWVSSTQTLDSEENSINEQPEALAAAQNKRNKPAQPKNMFLYSDVN